MNHTADWYIRGEYLETCNCDVVCPCLISNLNQNEALPTYGHCDLMCSYHVDEGEYNGIDLSGLSHIIMCYTPREMKWHDWSMAHYYDNKATPEQREAMLNIFKGKAGGPAEDLNAAMAVDLGTVGADIMFERTKGSRTARIPGIYINYSKAAQGMQKPDEYTKLRNLHPQCYEVYPAVCVDGRWHDHNMHFNNSGKTSVWGEIYWSPDSSLDQPSKHKGIPEN